MTEGGRRAWVVAAALALGAAATGCGASGPLKAARREATPAWQDIFDGTPELYAVVRLQAMKRDPVYGSFFKSLLRVAQARAETIGVTALEAVEGCDEIVVGVTKKEGEPEDAAIVLRGVPASLDPRRMTDASGQPLLRVVDDRAKVAELERLDRKNLAGGSLFVLPDRTWVVAVGGARARARQAFASPFGRPPPRSDAEALAAVRLDAGAFLKNGRFGRSPLTAPLAKRLASATVALKPGKGGVVVTLQYEDEDATAWSELHAKRLIEELATANDASLKLPPALRRPTSPPVAESGRLAWLNGAAVSREGSSVVVRLPIPPRLLEELPIASAGDFAP